jgi:hypothetical protein
MKKFFVIGYWLLVVGCLSVSAFPVGGRGVTVKGSVSSGEVVQFINGSQVEGSGKSAAEVATADDLATKQPLEDQRLSTTNSPTFTAVIWSYTAADGTNYLKEVTVNTNGTFEATTVNE